MKWNIDRELARAAKFLDGDGLEISMKRVLLAHSLFGRFNLKVIDSSKIVSPVWVIRIPWGATFWVVCGHTLHEAHLKLRRKLRKEKMWKATKRRHFKNERRRSVADE